MTTRNPERNRAEDADEPDDYEVGYAKPPKQHQFKPGHSGNPRGRPKGKKNLKTELQEALSERVSVRTGDGRKRKVPAISAVVRVNLQRALSGDANAAKLIFGLLDRYAPPDASDGDAPDLTFGNVEDKLDRYLSWRFGVPSASNEPANEDSEED
ncbi:MAG: hypothetical protein KDJ90_07580 [Nitratireductor sp.]|nr:hypothetical protein [Nitratireductor sp.]